MAPAVASAQGYYGPPPGGGGYYAQPPGLLPGGYFDRTGRLALGFSIGLGGMSSSNQGDIGCPSCDWNPVAGEADFHVGGMLSPQFALLFELQLNAQTIDQVNQGEGTVTLSQGVAMIAGQYWVTPHLWIKGGIGAAHLSYDFNDAYQTQSEPIDNGAALMAGAGYEVYATREFAVDLQARIIEGTYKGIDDQITSGTVGVGFNWY
ncbi:MAG TPA: hypothetical protein VL463_05420 [Kofleriaceae bacterium]|nr:hypothetical protein [Kofleriaceae bacterium]